MYEEKEYATEKLTACIYAALRWPNNDPTVVAAWSENRYIVSALIRRAFTNYEWAVVNRIGGKEPRLPNSQTE
jgi:hypothetical protein